MGYATSLKTHDYMVYAATLHLKCVSMKTATHTPDPTTYILSVQMVRTKLGIPLHGVPVRLYTYKCALP